MNQNIQKNLTPKNNSPEFPNFSKIQQNSNLIPNPHHSPINRVSILDCFDYYQKMDFFNSFYCNFCRGDSAVYSQTRLVDTPKTLIIKLNILVIS